MGEQEKLLGTVVKTKTGALQGIITLSDGSRKRLPSFPKGTSLEMAKERTHVKALEARALGTKKPVPAGIAAVTPGEEWWTRYLAFRSELGLTSVSGLYNTHIKPRVDKHPKGVTPADCEALRDALDAGTRAEASSAKTAFNAWTVWTTAMKAAAGLWKKDKSKRLKVRDDDPCVGVAPTDADDPKELQWLYPDEFFKLVSFPEVPLEWRQRYALGTYLFVRGGELKALRWSDVDIERGIVTVRLAFDRERGVVKATKTGNRGIRTFAIEPALLPMLRAMHRAADGEGNVVAMPAQKWWAASLRRDLALAGITRAGLFETDATRKRLRFHDLRSSGLTWMAIRGDDPLKIMQRAGHTNFTTTQKYLRAAEAVGVAIGEVFPGLPEDLGDHPPRSPEVQLSETIVEAPGIEPGSARRPDNSRSRA